MIKTIKQNRSIKLVVDTLNEYFPYSIVTKNNGIELRRFELKEKEKALNEFKRLSKV